MSELFASELVLIGADSREELIDEINRLIRFIEQAPEVTVKDISYTCSLEAKGRRHVISFVTDNSQDLLVRLRTASVRLGDDVSRIRDKSGTYYAKEHLAGPGTHGKVAFLYPGAASYYPDMLSELAILFPEVRKPFDELEEAVSGAGRFSPASFIFPPAPYYRHDADVFASGGYAQALVATLCANGGMTALMQALGVKPDGMLGFAGGDLTALAFAGVFGHIPHHKRVEFLRDCYSMIDRAVDRSGLPKCVMVSAISPRAGQIAGALAEYTSSQVAVAFNQTQRQQTLAIRPEIANDVIAGFSEMGIRTLRLAVDRPFNTEWCESITSELSKFGKRWADSAPEIPVYSCASARPLPEKVRHIREEQVAQWVTQVRFEETIRRMYEDGYRVFIEAGPRGSMCAAVDEILRGLPHVAIALDRVHRSGLSQLHHALAALAALGVPVDGTFLHSRRRKRHLDFDAPLSLQVRADKEMHLSRALPHLELFSDEATLGVSYAPARGPGKAAARNAAIARTNRRQKPLEFGSSQPLISDADVVDMIPGVSIEIFKEYRVKEAPFISDYAYGTAQISYSDPALRGLTLLPLTVGAEIMAELAQRLVPNRQVVRVDDLAGRHAVAFKDGRLKLYVRAERVASPDPDLAAVKVQIRDDSVNSAYTWPVVEGTFLLSADPPELSAIVPEPLAKPRSVHWTDRDIYPERLHYGPRLQSVKKADQWSEAGLNYEVEVPPRAGALTDIRFPIWVIDPQMLEGVISGFQLWRAHDSKSGSFSLPFRIRRLMLHAASFQDGASLRCYLRLTSVTPRSHISDVNVSDGNGNLLFEIHGLEELTERVPLEYRNTILAPATTFITQPVPKDTLGDPPFAVASALVSDVPYPMFERNDELWLKMLSNVVLGPAERRNFAEMTGSVSRRTEWLFGRIAAKESVRRYLSINYQARWSDADIQIWADDQGKPHALGQWSDFISSHLDLSIAHTANLVVAAVASNARIGLDVEAVGRDLSDEFTSGVFNPEELELATGALNTPNVILQFWCAKEAVSKALGTGIRFSPKDLVITAYNADTGEITMRLRNAWLDQFKDFTGRDIKISSTIIRDHALASCFLPASLFGE